MKTLRYLLIVMGLMSVLSISAQALAQQPEVYMQSTSGMVYSGSQLPSAAAQGTYVTGSTVGTYTAVGGGSRRAKKEDNPGGGFNPGGGEPGPGDNSEPWEDPIGDAALPLALLACVYIGVRAFINNKRKMTQK